MLSITLFEKFAVTFYYYEQLSKIWIGRVTRKPTFCICKNKAADQLRGISAFIFATRIVQSLFFLNPKFQASSYLQ